MVDKRRQPLGENPYRSALDVGLVQVTRFLHDHGERRLTHVIVESRGKNEDLDLRTAFDAYCTPHGSLAGCNLALEFAPKAHCHAGMELADMVARPIGRHALAPAQPNRAYDILATKLWRPTEATDGLVLLPPSIPPEAGAPRE